MAMGITESTVQNHLAHALALILGSVGQAGRTPMHEQHDNRCNEDDSRKPGAAVNGPDSEPV